VTELVSILIPSYNAESWIRETIESALSQTWANKEIIVVDDGSRDNTFRIAKSFDSKMVKVISQENSGAAAARNRALEFAQGDYIQWLDADDLLAPDKISEQMKAVSSNQSDLILYTAAHGAFYRCPENATFIPDSLWQDLAPEDWLINNFSENIWMSSNAWLVSRRLTETVGPWDERLSLNDDGEYFCRLVARSEKIKFVGDARCYHRKSGLNSLSLSASETACKSLLLSMRLSIQYLACLEESERTKIASVALLQKYLELFYLDKVDLLEEINALAFEFGGQLIPHKNNWKVNLLEKLLGRRLAEKSIITYRQLRFAAAVKMDKLIST
jgi:glycosyltransferase involved in cell wall biosynthesis